MVRTPLPNRWCVSPPSELRWHSPWKGHIPPAIADLQRLFGYVKCTFHASIFGQNMNSNPYHLAKVRRWMVAKSCTSRRWTFRYRLSTILLVVLDFASIHSRDIPIPQITINEVINPFPNVWLIIVLTTLGNIPLLVEYQQQGGSHHLTGNDCPKNVGATVTFLLFSIFFACNKHNSSKTYLYPVRV